MPAALYAISFKRTGHVLAICSFEKQTLADADAARALLEKLVDKHLDLASTGQAIRVGLDELALDPIGGKAAPAEVIANPWAYQVQGQLTQLGDGTDKQLARATINTVDSVTLAAGGALTINLHSDDPIPHEAFVFFEGAPDPITGVTLTNSKQLTMSVTAVPVNANTAYGLIFAKDGIPATVVYVTAT